MKVLAATEAFPIVPKKKKVREDLGDKLVSMLSTALEAENVAMPEQMQMVQDETRRKSVMSVGVIGRMA